MRYFDSAASYPLSKNILEDLSSLVARHQYVNPFSPHHAGKKGHDLLNISRKQIASLFQVSPKALYFTSGATESINLIIHGYARHLERISSPRNEIIISSTEHASVYHTALALKRLGWKIIEVPVDKSGKVNIDAIRKAITPKTAIVSIIYVNNETGSINDIPNIFEFVKSVDPNILCMTDTAQAIGKIQVNLEHADAFVISGHKIGAFKGIGAFYLNPKFRLVPLFYGGGQEQGYRPGTTDPIAVSLLANVLSRQIDNLPNLYNKICSIREALIKGLEGLSIPYKISTPLGDSSPYILSLSIASLPGNKLIDELSEKGIYLSGGAACSSVCNIKSRVLSAIGIPDKQSSETVRISFSEQTTLDDIKILVEAINELIQKQ